MREHGHFLRSIAYVGFGIGTLVVLFPWAIRALGIEVLAFDPRMLRWPGAAVAALGAVMYFSCAWDFNATGRGTPAFWEPPRRFVRNRWFDAVRNPMYLGVALMNVGQGVFFGSVAIVVYAVLVTAAFHGFVVLYEEPHLRRVYGESYRAYCERVPRWLPRVR